MGNFEKNPHIYFRWFDRYTIIWSIYVIHSHKIFWLFHCSLPAILEFMQIIEKSCKRSTNLFDICEYIWWSGQTSKTFQLPLISFIDPRGEEFGYNIRYAFSVNSKLWFLCEQFSPSHSSRFLDNNQSTSIFVCHRYC